MATTFALTLFDNRFARTLRTREVTWPSFVEALEDIPVQPVKNDAPLIKLARFGANRTDGGSLRSDANVLAITGLEGDYDAEQVTPEEAIERLEQYRIRACVVTSWSHDPSAPRWRVYAPLTREYDPVERRHLLARLNGALGGILGRESFALSQSYFVGGRPGGEYRVLNTFGDPEEGFCIDELEDLDAVAVSPPQQNGNGTNGSAPGQVKAMAPSEILELLQGVPEQGPPMGRGSAALKIIGHFLGKRLAPDVVEALALDWNQKNRPPLPDAEIRDKVRRLAMKDAAKPENDTARSVHGAEVAASLLENGATAAAGAEPRRKIPAPMSMRDLLAHEEPEEAWIFEGCMPLDANVLIAGYPKSHKTNFLLELGVAGASGSAFLGRFAATRSFRVGLILMEDRAHRIRRRLRRIADAHAVTLEDLDGQLFIWFRPPLRLGDATAMRDLGAWIDECQLDALFVDNWSLVSEGDSDKADQVTPQLDRITGLREGRALTVGLVHHARKGPKEAAGGERLTDMIRNSSAFGAWYDAGFGLIRDGEGSTVTVRTELRDVPTESFAFTVEDEVPASPESGPYPRGWLRLQATDGSPEAARREQAAAKFVPAVIDHLRQNPGCSKNALEGAIKGERQLIRDAFEHLCATGFARFEPPQTRGKSGRCYLTNQTSPSLAVTSPAANSLDLADLAVPPRSGGRQARSGESPSPEPRRTPLPLAAGAEEEF